MIKKKVIELIDVGVPNLLRHFMEWDLKACDEVCGKKQRRYMVVE